MKKSCGNCKHEYCNCVNEWLESWCRKLNENIESRRSEPCEHWEIAEREECASCIYNTGKGVCDKYRKYLNGECLEHKEQ